MDTSLVDPDAMEARWKNKRRKLRGMLRKVWDHVSKAHEEASCAAGELARLSMVLELDDCFKVVEAET